jgi:polysaccharide biosynthesis protein PslH
MRILQITNKVPYPDNDGGTIACLNLTRGFFSLGHQVTILAMVTLKHTVSVKDIPDNIKKLADFILVNVPAPITAFGALKNLFFSNLPYNAERFIDNTFKDELIKLLKKNEFDVIQLEGLYVCPYIKTIHEYSKATIVYRAHNIEFEIWERSVLLAKGLKKWYLNIISKRLKKFETGFLNSYDLLVPITPRDAGIFNHLGNIKPVHVSQTGIDTSFLSPDISLTEHPAIFHIGALDWAPNQEAILWFLNNCWGKLSGKYPDLKLYIAGRNAPGWFIKKVHGPNIVFVGEIKDAYQFINSKSIMIVPLFAGSGMRIKIIEGMALGKAIVTTTIGTEGIDTTHNENILIANSKEEFIAAVSELIENKPLVEKIGFNAIRYIHENFDNTAIAGQLISFYKKHKGWD